MAGWFYIPHFPILKPLMYLLLYSTKVVAKILFDVRFVSAEVA